MTTRELFGGKSPKPLPYHPLPYMEEYLENLRAEERTASYLQVVKLGLTRFSNYLREEEQVKHPDEITRAHVLRYQAHLLTLVGHSGDPLTVAYRQQLMKYARGWVYWLMEVEYIDGNPWVRIRIGRTVKKPKPMEDDEIALLFDAHRKQAFAIPPFFFHRREVALVLLYAWGLRLNELQSLTVAGMDMRQEWVTVRNKGGGPKVLPYADELKLVVQRWLMKRSKYAKAGDDSLLIDQQGKQLSSAMLYKIVKECGDRAGITINPHRLRDTFGTTMLDHDVEVERIMKMMGHTQRSQTLAYARVNDHKIKESHDRVMNPLLHKLLNG